MQFYVFDDRRAKVVLGPKAREFIQLQKNTGYDLQYRERIYACDQLTHFLSGMKVDADIQFYNQRGEPMLDHTRRIPEAAAEEKKEEKPTKPVEKKIPPDKRRKTSYRVVIPRVPTNHPMRIEAASCRPAPHDLVVSTFPDDSDSSDPKRLWVVIEVEWQGVGIDGCCKGVPAILIMDDKGNKHIGPLSLFTNGHLRILERVWMDRGMQPEKGDSVAMPWHTHHNLTPDIVTRISTAERRAYLEWLMPNPRGYSSLDLRRFDLPDNDASAARVLYRRFFKE